VKFRKNPVVIEAIKFPLREYADDPLVFREEPPTWLQEAITDGTITPEFRTEDYWYLRIKTLEGDHLATPGDFIIRGVKGEIYPCKPDIFAATYEPAPPMTIESARRIVAALKDTVRPTFIETELRCAQSLIDGHASRDGEVAGWIADRDSWIERFKELQNENERLGAAVAKLKQLHCNGLCRTYEAALSRHLDEQRSSFAGALDRALRSVRQLISDEIIRDRDARIAGFLMTDPCPECKSTDKVIRYAARRCGNCNHDFQNSAHPATEAGEGKEK
jgi:hypothetical protein